MEIAQDDDDDDCKYDTLDVTFGSSPSDWHGTFCGSRLPANVTSPGDMRLALMRLMLKIILLELQMILPDCTFIPTARRRGAVLPRNSRQESKFNCHFGP